MTSVCWALCLGARGMMMAGSVLLVMRIAYGGGSLLSTLTLPGILMDVSEHAG